MAQTFFEDLETAMYPSALLHTCLLYTSHGNHERFFWLLQ